MLSYVSDKEHCRSKFETPQKALKAEYQSHCQGEGTAIDARYEGNLPQSVAWVQRCTATSGGNNTGGPGDIIPAPVAPDFGKQRQILSEDQGC